MQNKFKKKHKRSSIQTEYNCIIECGKFGKSKNSSIKGLISDDSHGNTHLSPSSNEITTTNKNIPKH